MIVTDEAKNKLKETLLANTNDPEVCLRLVMNSPPKLGLALGLVLDKEAEGDEVIEHEGSKILLIGKEMADTGNNFTLDSQDTPDGEGKQLVFSMD